MPLENSNPPLLSRDGRGLSLDPPARSAFVGDENPRTHSHLARAPALLAQLEVKGF